MMRSPGLCSSTHALILGSLRVTVKRYSNVRRKDNGLPFVLLANIISFAQVDEVDDGLGGE